MSETIKSVVFSASVGPLDMSEANFSTFLDKIVLLNMSEASFRVKKWSLNMFEISFNSFLIKKKGITLTCLKLVSVLFLSKIGSIN